ncbi:hypothetical protein N656DRAFT_171854 [Canariomyces notabilis]|uniref:Uncharacterized protein n=1 Tax=Canariomyces notabilis TaxID=2074819 RepID=A0AAN6TB75_9PEZI|nr:hypothetical protein N656DRAFT_171854 [Canariomyces arenarius]
MSGGQNHVSPASEAMPATSIPVAEQEGLYPNQGHRTGNQPVVAVRQNFRGVNQFARSVASVAGPSQPNSVSSVNSDNPSSDNKRKGTESDDNDESPNKRRQTSITSSTTFLVPSSITSSIKAGVNAAVQLVLKEINETGTAFAQLLMDGPLADFHSPQAQARIEQTIMRLINEVNAMNIESDQRAFNNGAFKALQEILREAEELGQVFGETLLQGAISGQELLEARRRMSRMYRDIMVSYTPLPGAQPAQNVNGVPVRPSSNLAPVPPAWPSRASGSNQNVVGAVVNPATWSPEASPTGVHNQNGPRAVSTAAAAQTPEATQGVFNQDFTVFGPTPIPGTSTGSDNSNGDGDSPLRPLVLPEGFVPIFPPSVPSSQQMATPSPTPEAPAPESFDATIFALRMPPTDPALLPAFDDVPVKEKKLRKRRANQGASGQAAPRKRAKKNKADDEPKVSTVEKVRPSWTYTFGTRLHGLEKESGGLVRLPGATARMEATIARFKAAVLEELAMEEEQIPSGFVYLARLGHEQNMAALRRLLKKLAKEAALAAGLEWEEDEEEEDEEGEGEEE